MRIDRRMSIVPPDVRRQRNGDLRNRIPARTLPASLHAGTRPMNGLPIFGGSMVTTPFDHSGPKSSRYVVIGLFG